MLETSWSNKDSIWRTVFQHLNCGDSNTLLFLQNAFFSFSFSCVSSQYFAQACSCRVWRTTMVISWAYLAQLTWEDVKHAWATPLLATLACTRVSVHPLLTNHFTRMFSSIISMWRDPIIIMTLSSPCVFGERHRICFKFPHHYTGRRRRHFSTIDTGLISRPWEWLPFELSKC